MTQYQIEKLAGIDSPAIADYMMAGRTPAAQRAMELLRMQVDFYEPAGMALLAATVDDCKKEMIDKKGT